MNFDLNAEKSCEEKSICAGNNIASLYPPPRPPRHRRLNSSGGHAVDKEQRRSGNHARFFTGSLQESLLFRSDNSHTQDQYCSLRSDVMNSNSNNNRFIAKQLDEMSTDEYASVKIPMKRISFGSCKQMFVVVLVKIAVIACLLVLFQLFSDWRAGDIGFQKSTRIGGFADRMLREAKFGSVGDVLHVKNTEP